MTTRQAINQTLKNLSDVQMREVLDFTLFLADSNEANEWNIASKQRLSEAYGDNEPEYTLDMIKPELAKL